MCLGAIYWARIARVFYGSLASDAAQAGFRRSAIYAEFARPHAKRKIPMIPMMRQEALARFGSGKKSRARLSIELRGRQPPWLRRQYSFYLVSLSVAPLPCLP